MNWSDTFERMGGLIAVLRAQITRFESGESDSLNEDILSSAFNSYFELHEHLLTFDFDYERSRSRFHLLLEFHSLREQLHEIRKQIKQTTAKRLAAELLHENQPQPCEQLPVFGVLVKRVSKSVKPKKIFKRVMQLQAC